MSSITISNTVCDYYIYTSLLFTGTSLISPSTTSKDNVNRNRGRGSGGIAAGVSGWGSSSSSSGGNNTKVISKIKEKLPEPHQNVQYESYKGRPTHIKVSNP